MSVDLAASVAPGYHATFINTEKFVVIAGRPREFEEPFRKFKVGGVLVHKTSHEMAMALQCFVVDEPRQLRVRLSCVILLVDQRSKLNWSELELCHRVQNARGRASNLVEVLRPVTRLAQEPKRD